MPRNVYPLPEGSNGPNGSPNGSNGPNGPNGRAFPSETGGAENGAPAGKDREAAPRRDGRDYLLMRHLPSSERPRERLARYGPEQLSNTELLAIIWRTG